MKMKAADRILIALYAFWGAVTVALFGVCAVCPVLAEDLGELAARILNNSIAVQICAVLLAIVMFAWSLRLFVLAIGREGSKPSSSASVQESVGGSVRVSVRAMETLVVRAVEQTDGILDRKIRINNHDDSVTVEIDLVIGIETHVPQVTALLQRNVKGIVEEFSGIAVREVVVLVTEIKNDAPPALPAPKDEAAQTVVVVPEQVEVTHAPAGEAEVEPEPVIEEMPTEPETAEAAEAEAPVTEEMSAEPETAEAAGAEAPEADEPVEDAGESGRAEKPAEEKAAEAEA